MLEATASSLTRVLMSGGLESYSASRKRAALPRKPRR